MTEKFELLITKYKADPESVYNTWFANNDERLKAFRSIRRGVQQVIKDIKDKKFPNDFKGSSLEFVLSCISEQKQVFVGVAHPFYWKPKLRIPDIYENEKHKSLLSNDLGAFAGLLFEIGAKKTIIGEGKFITEEDKIRFEKQVEKRRKEVESEQLEVDVHSEMQYHLLKIGQALGYDVISASNDRSKSHQGNNFSFLSLSNFPKMEISKETYNTIGLIDVVWFEKGTNKPICAFEVEKSTSIYSGILRLTDLSYSFTESEQHLYIVLPNNREKEVVMQLSRPSIKSSQTKIQYILFSELREHCDALCKFGESHNILKKIARTA